MVKETKYTKDERKKPALSFKEKRARKQEKRKMKQEHRLEERNIE